MDENAAKDELGQLARQLGINLDKGSYLVSGGLCQLRGEYFIINSRSSMTERIQILAKALKHFFENLNDGQIYCRSFASRC